MISAGLFVFHNWMDLLVRKEEANTGWVTCMMVPRCRRVVAVTLGKMRTGCSAVRTSCTTVSAGHRAGSRASGIGGVVVDGLALVLAGVLVVGELVLDSANDSHGVWFEWLCVNERSSEVSCFISTPVRFTHPHLPPDLS